jgi:hypothetical protein
MRYDCGECFGHWILKIEIYLYFDAWDLEFYCLIKPSMQLVKNHFNVTLSRRSVHFDKSHDMIYKISWLKMFDSAAKNELKPKFIYLHPRR